MILRKQSDRESSSRVKCYGSEEIASFRARNWPGFTESSSLLVLRQDRFGSEKSGTYRPDSTGVMRRLCLESAAIIRRLRNRSVLGFSKTGFGQRALHLLKA